MNDLTARAQAFAADPERFQDDETRGLVELIRRSDVWDRLARDGWYHIADGQDGLGLFEKRRRGGFRLIHSIARELDGNAWAHVSVSRHDRNMPTWEQTRDAWWLLYPDVAGVIVVPPRTNHVNIAEVSHVWGNLNTPSVPDFTHGLATI